MGQRRDGFSARFRTSLLSFTPAGLRCSLKYGGHEELTRIYELPQAESRPFGSTDTSASERPHHTETLRVMPVLNPSSTWFRIMAQY